uniref:Coiled-coil domain containing 12 n=1 Tax=Naja naja TaxID=35670 RepID=A0A8C6YFG1_NAJNA
VIGEASGESQVQLQLGPIASNSAVHIFLPSLFRDLKLRNYIPEDVELKERVVPNAKPASVEEKVKEQLEAAKPELIIEEVDLANLAPRKPDWDLKRDVAKKLEKLEKRTQRAIAELIRESGLWGRNIAAPRSFVIHFPQKRPKKTLFFLVFSFEDVPLLIEEASLALAGRWGMEGFLLLADKAGHLHPLRESPRPPGGLSVSSGSK